MSFQKFIAGDLEVDGNYDLLMKDGDFVVAASDDHTQELIIISSKGSFRFAPMVGVEIYTYLNSTGQVDSIKRDIQEQLRLDGYRVDEIEFTEDNQIKIIAKRIR
jgi:hypothetical protein